MKNARCHKSFPETCSVTTLRLKWFDSRQGKENFLFCRVQASFGAKLSSYSMGTGGSFHGVKATGREADHSPISRSEVKMIGVIPPLSLTPSSRAQGQICFFFTFFTFWRDMTPYSAVDRLQCFGGTSLFCIPRAGFGGMLCGGGMAGWRQCGPSSNVYLFLSWRLE
jgi:hypothetical protein